MVKKEFKIEGMSCQHCVKSIEIELSEIGIKSYDVKIGSASVDYDENEISESEIVNAIHEAGFKVV